MERIIDPSNLQKASKQVVQNAGNGGSWQDGSWRTSRMVKPKLEEISRRIIKWWKPSPVKGIEIPKPQGGIRLLGIPTVKDRLVQQAILGILTPMYDKTFSDNSYGFRFKRNAHQALAKACQNVKDGYTIIVDIDLTKFFDEVNHHRLIWMLGTRIGDKRVLRLINLFLKTGIFLEGMESQRIKGTPQGRSLKPLIIQYCTWRVRPRTTKMRTPICRVCGWFTDFCKNQRECIESLRKYQNFHWNPHETES